MAVLSNTDLRARLALATEQRIIVEPLAEDAVQPASIDVRLGTQLLAWTGGRQVVDLAHDQSANWRLMSMLGGVWWLEPGRLYLATTLEYVQIPVDLLAHMHGRSTNARAGIVPHQEAGLLDPGYRGRPTLEITVLMWTVVRPADPIGQLTFETLSSPADPPYSGRYQGDHAPAPATPFRVERAP